MKPRNSVLKFVEKPFRFLTHTVQMKRKAVPVTTFYNHTFLTHTVQMKLCSTLLWRRADPSFLTHTVQMKHNFCNTNPWFSKEVLNPHGSDETVIVRVDNKIVYEFLTHTVQMKQMAMEEEMMGDEEVLNPHGSDETYFFLFF